MPADMVTSEMRRAAKAVNFGIVYGIGAFSLAKDIGVTRKEADAYIKGYLMNFSGVDNYMKEVVARAKTDGYVSTLFGRRRYLPEITASNKMLVGFGERVARNMPIQGTAADIIKIAMVRVYNRLKAEGMQSKLIMQIHDELIVEAIRNDLFAKMQKLPVRYFDSHPTGEIMSRFTNDIDKNTLLIIDEPEAHLHPQWIVEYARILVLLKKEIGVRILIASHNPDMVAAIQSIGKKEGIGDAITFYQAFSSPEHPFEYEYKNLGIEISEIFKSFNIAISRIQDYGRTDNQ